MNITICSAAIVILLSSVFMMFLKDKNLFLRFMNTLDNKQKQIYERIIRSNCNTRTICSYNNFIDYQSFIRFYRR